MFLSGTKGNTCVFSRPGTCYTNEEPGKKKNNHPTLEHYLYEVTLNKGAASRGCSAFLLKAKSLAESLFPRLPLMRNVAAFVLAEALRVTNEPKRSEAGLGHVRQRPAVNCRGGGRRTEVG